MTTRSFYRVTAREAADEGARPVMKARGPLMKARGH
jgi:hypothetical protein